MGRKQSKGQIRNLAQYKDLTEEQFDAMWGIKSSIDNNQDDFQERIENKIKEFAKDYDLDDLKINDTETLRALVRALIALEDYEVMVYDIRSIADISQSNINVVDRIQKVMSDLRRDISKLQEDLNITRKIRKSDKESSVAAYISGLKEQARKFYESKASYIFCPECDMLLATVWSLYPEENNKISLVCNREKDDGEICGHKFTITTSELLKNRGTNKPEITPESLL